MLFKYLRSPVPKIRGLSLHKYAVIKPKSAMINRNFTGKTHCLYVSNRLIVLTLQPVTERIVTKFVSNRWKFNFACLYSRTSFTYVHVSSKNGAGNVWCQWWSATFSEKKILWLLFINLDIPRIINIVGILWSCYRSVVRRVQYQSNAWPCASLHILARQRIRGEFSNSPRLYVFLATISGWWRMSECLVSTIFACVGS